MCLQSTLARAKTETKINLGGRAAPRPPAARTETLGKFAPSQQKTFPPSNQLRRLMWMSQDEQCYFNYTDNFHSISRTRFVHGHWYPPPFNALMFIKWQKCSHVHFGGCSAKNLAEKLEHTDLGKGEGRGGLMFSGVTLKTNRKRPKWTWSPPFGI